MQLETDQDTCYDMLGKQIDCRDSGHDAGYKRPDRTGFANRFQVTGDSVKDSLSGLLWKRQASLSEFPLSWKEAAVFIEELNDSENDTMGGWRLPTRRELFSLVSHQLINPSLPAGHPFTDVFHGYYWTGTTCARLPDQAWYIHMGGAKVYRGMKHGSYMVWPVSGQSAEAGKIKYRFAVHGDVVFDSVTGRHWYTGNKLNRKAHTWDEALSLIHELNDGCYGSYNDWRLPNIRELESLVDDSRHSPALAKGFLLPGFQQVEGYWSSTTSVYEPRYAWVLYPIDGAIGVGYKPQTDFHTLPVRT